jgi:hypothetical protein
VARLNASINIILPWFYTKAILLLFSSRFTQEDMYRGDGLNLYAYVSNNPIRYVDPSGYMCEVKGKQAVSNIREKCKTAS